MHSPMSVDLMFRAVTRSWIKPGSATPIQAADLSRDKCTGVKLWVRALQPPHQAAPRLKALSNSLLGGWLLWEYATKSHRSRCSGTLVMHHMLLCHNQLFFSHHSSRCHSADSPNIYHQPKLSLDFLNSVVKTHNRCLFDRRSLKSGARRSNPNMCVTPEMCRFPWPCN